MIDALAGRYARVRVVARGNGSGAGQDAHCEHGGGGRVLDIVGAVNSGVAASI